MEKNNSIVLATERELAPAIEKAQSIVIRTPDDMILATQVLSALNRVMDKVAEEKNKVLRPILDAAQAERARWKPIETQYEGAIKPLRAKISTYQTAEVAKQQEAADKLAKDIAKGRVSLDEASTALSAVQGPEAKVTTALGSVGFRAIQTLKITNAKLVPEKYWVIDESTLLADLKAGKKVKGATIEIIQSPINRR